MRGKGRGMRGGSEREREKNRVMGEGRKKVGEFMEEEEGGRAQSGSGGESLGMREVIEREGER